MGGPQLLLSATMSSRRVLVFGATGTQGFAVANLLISQGWKVNALSRNLGSGKAKELISIGANMTQGDWNDTDAIASAMTDCDALFLNLTPTFQDMGREAPLTKHILGIAAKEGVQHVVYSSAFARRGDRDLGLVTQAQKGKAAVEAVIQGYSVGRWTILRPGWFMDNFLAPKVAYQHVGVVETGIFNVGFKRDTLMPLTDHADIAAFAVAAMGDPSRFHGQSITLASELLRAEVAFEKLASVAGRNLKTMYMVDEVVEAAMEKNPLIASHITVQTMAQEVDMEELRGWKVPLSSFDEFLQREKDRVRETYRVDAQ
jgi:uncharacterized protein YbjT (DUF2867 family)